MVISYLGGECFKVSQGDLTLAFNPPGKGSTLASAKFGADIALVSLDHKDFNGLDNASFGEREPFAIEGAGEYEVKGVEVRGWGAKATYAGQETINTIYSVGVEGMNLAFLGALSSSDLPPKAKQELDDIDILFVPVDTLGVAPAYKLVVALGPKAVVPMHYTPASLKAFLKEAGAEDAKPQEKLTLKKKDLEGKEAEIVVLSS
jgi:L-ascorbate metabolism protein UlaG (beta-lactamase superfamily)